MIWFFFFEGYLNIFGEDGVVGLVVLLMLMVYYGMMVGCYVLGILLIYVNKLYKVLVGYFGCWGICLFKCF